MYNVVYVCDVSDVRKIKRRGKWVVEQKRGKGRQFIAEGKGEGSQKKRGSLRKRHWYERADRGKR